MDTPLLTRGQGEPLAGDSNNYQTQNPKDRPELWKDGNVESVPDSLGDISIEDSDEEFYMQTCSFLDELDKLTTAHNIPQQPKERVETSFSYSQDLEDMPQAAGFPLVRTLTDAPKTKTTPPIPPQGASLSTISSGSNPSSVLGKRKADALETSPISSTRKKVKLENHHTIYIQPNKELPIFIAQNKFIEATIQEHSLSFGTQWELARLSSHGFLDADKLKDPRLLNELKGSNAVAAANTASLVCNGETKAEEKPSDKENSARTPWAELDKELAALAQDEFAGLGHSPYFPQWYGGRINFLAKLDVYKRGVNERTTKRSHDELEYRIVLSSPELGPSNRTTRRFGSWSLIRVKVPQPLIRSRNQKLSEYFMSPFVIFGTVYRAFCAKDENVFLIRTNEIIDSQGLARPGPLGASGLTLDSFINWANPLQYNQNQLMCKWAARFALVLSNSVPGPQLEEHEILDEPDIVNTHPDTKEESDMTDGCGFTARAVAVDMYNSLHLPSVPSAFQVRLGGSKGLVAAHGDYSLSRQVRIRPSQLKIRYDRSKPLDPAHRILDVLRTNHLRHPARISAEIIRALEDCGVPADVFKDLFERNVKETFDALTRWADPQYEKNETEEMVRDLWVAVEKTEGVVGARKARLMSGTGEGRLRGFAEKEDEDDDGDDDGVDGDVTAQRSVAWFPDPVSGSPSSLAETVMSLLDSGFTPRNCPVVLEKLEKIVGKMIERKTSKIQFDVPESLSAFVIPAPDGIVLGRREIFVKSSRHMFKTAEGVDTDILLGDVVITRNPCKVASDVQKVQAVDCPALHHLVDVIVCNVADHRRLLDFLSGGDYDGDRCIVIYDRHIVDTFKQADDKFSKPSPSVALAFDRDTLTVKQFLVDSERRSLTETRCALQKYVLGALRDTSTLGTYSTYHDNAVHKLGYSDRVTVNLAYKFNVLMDSAKSGHILKDKVFKADRAAHSHSIGPAWKEQERKLKKKSRTSFGNTSNSGPLVRDLSKPRQFHRGRDEIMNILFQHAAHARQCYLQKLDTTFKTPALFRGFRPPDHHLDQPWHDHEELAKKRAAQGNHGLQNDLTKLKIHVEAIYDFHKERIKMKDDGGTGFTMLPIVQRQDILRSCSKRFATYPSIDDMEVITDSALVARLCASYAYCVDWYRHGRSKCTRFPYDVAFRELCKIKADAVGPSKTMLTSFYERMRVVN
ncbi:RNA dependent RNA polymerase-domain-containing protein [Flagelloscypha sp. PMI_526]|nr:RNA dependent RNA polymerase-domain-containing protein [Flagelloscypha sp. PMI_526]